MRNGKIVTHDAIGFQDRAAKTSMKNDSIFRIASLTKLITAIAAMILAEENELNISAPVAKYLPEFKDVKAGIEGAAPKRPMTIQDLMRHTAGLTHGRYRDSPVNDLCKKANLLDAKSLDEMVKTIAGLPLLHQPGEVWEYSDSTDVLDRVVEVASGMDLDRFVQARITGPLKMEDTGFWLKTQTKPAPKPTILSGGDGLFSSAGDYACFCQMLLNGGELDGVRIL